MEQKPGYEYSLKQTSQFKKDLKAVKFDERKLDELQKVFEYLGRTGLVPAEYLPHPLKGQYKNCMELKKYNRKLGFLKRKYYFCPTYWKKGIQVTK